MEGIFQLHFHSQVMAPLVQDLGGRNYPYHSSPHPEPQSPTVSSTTASTPTTRLPLERSRYVETSGVTPSYAKL